MLLRSVLESNISPARRQRGYVVVIGVLTEGLKDRWTGTNYHELSNIAAK